MSDFQNVEVNSRPAGTVFPQNPARATLWLIALTLPVRLLIAAVSGLGYGESYYMLNIIRPQLSYFDQPPLAFWLSWLSVQACGAMNALTLRLPFVLCFAVITWLMFLLGKRLFGARAGFYAALLLNLSAVFTVTTASWLQPDAPLMLFWLATALCLVRIFGIDGEKNSSSAENEDLSARRKGALKWWLLAGVLLGLTTLSKYHAAFLFAGAGLYALTTPRARHWLWHPGPYLALVINFIIASPIFIWNSQNNWASFFFQSGRAASSGKFALHWDWMCGSLGGQALWLLPWIWVPLLVLFGDCWRRGPRDRARWFCACTAVLPILFFTIVTLWAKLGFHFHWQAPGYLMLFPVLGVATANWMSSASLRIRVWARRWLGLSAVACLAVMAVLQLHAATGCWSARFFGPQYWMDLYNARYQQREEDPTLEGFDYDALRERFAAEKWLDNDRIFVAVTRWYMAGKAGWALRGKKDMLCMDSDPRNVAFLFAQKPLLGKDAILVTRQDENTVRPAAEEIFAEVRRLADLPIVRGGVTEFSLHLYYCRNFRKEYAYPDNYRSALVKP